MLLLLAKLEKNEERCPSLLAEKNQQNFTSKGEEEEGEKEYMKIVFRAFAFYVW